MATLSPAMEYLMPVGERCKLTSGENILNRMEFRLLMKGLDECELGPFYDYIEEDGILKIEELIGEMFDACCLDHPAINTCLHMCMVIEDTTISVVQGFYYDKHADLFEVGILKAGEPVKIEGYQDCLDLFHIMCDVAFDQFEKEE